MRGFPGQTPNPSAVNLVDTSGGVPIPVAPGAVVITAPEIKGGDVPKKIEFTVSILQGGPETYTFELRRDTTLVGFAYIFAPSAVGTELVTVHWYDDAPGKGKPVYTVTMIGAAGGVGAALDGRTITVHNV